MVTLLSAIYYPLSYLCYPLLHLQHPQLLLLVLLALLFPLQPQLFDSSVLLVLVPNITVLLGINGVVYAIKSLLPVQPQFALLLSLSLSPSHCSSLSKILHIVFTITAVINAKIVSAIATTRKLASNAANVTIKYMAKNVIPTKIGDLRTFCNTMASKIVAIGLSLIHI